MDIFSKRQQRSQQKGAEIYKYDDLPLPLRNQITFIFEELAAYFLSVQRNGLDTFFGNVWLSLREEYGVTQLTPDSKTTTEDVMNFFLNEGDVEKCLDVIEIVFACFARSVRTNLHVNFNGMDHMRASVAKLNARFQEHRIGYEFRDGQIIRIDSQFMHKEAVAPAMELLREPHLAGANAEFLKAHEHFRHGRYGESINECLKAFESTMKAICHKRKWAYSQTDTAKTLLERCEKGGLFPLFMLNSLSGLRSVLENVATVRNKLSGHGQGVQPIQITPEVAAFVLHSTGANILLLVSLEKGLK